ncbi:MAG: flagellum-specific peptidoglycan hydrolase FlgJ [Saprospiraceae bacterium]|jgi:flagellum-specific peptidoglycan hydrolase FlgJ
MRKFIQIILSSLRSLTSLSLYTKFLSMIIQAVFLFLVHNGLKVGLLLLGILFILRTDFNLQLQFNTNTEDIIPNSAEQFSFGKTLGDFLDFNTTAVSTMEVQTPERPKTTQAANTDWGNTYSNMTYDNQPAPAAQLKKEKQLAYVNRFKDVARSEMNKFGIPASIILAQGLIESNAGESRLSKENNNHFGMKCFSKSCKKGHCANFTDDSHKDFFRKYDTSWESFRSHSNLLSGKRYRSLRDHGKDYKKWSHGLKKAGYATDRRYAEKLIHIIEDLDLGQYDR